MILHRLLRAVFHLLYNQFAWTYDWVAAVVSAGHWVSWVRSAAPHLIGSGKILEIGHGPGYLLLEMQELGLTPIGADLSAAMGRRARRLLHKAGARADLVRADARRLPFPDEYFDAVVLTFPAEYIAEPETWRSFRRVLRQDGRVIVLLGAIPEGAHPFRLLSRAIFRVTGLTRVRELAEARIQLMTFLGEIGMEGELVTTAAGTSRLYYLLAERRQAGEDPAV